MATSVKHSRENISLVILLLPYRINWIQTEFSMLNFRGWSLTIRPLYNNCLIDGFISDQNLSFASMQACSMSFTQKVLWKDIWLLVTEIRVSMLLETQNLFCWKCIKCMLEYRIRRYQSFLSKLVQKVKRRLKELYNILRCFWSHFMSLLESVQSLPGDSQQNTSRNSGGCQVLLKTLWKLKTIWD